VAAKMLFAKSAVGASVTMLFEPSKNIPHDYSITVNLYANAPYAELVWNINAKPA
jgi:hypothetical protein